MEDVLKGNIVIDLSSAPFNYKIFLKNNTENRTIKVKDILGNETNVIPDSISHLVRIPENLLVHFGFDKYEGEQGVYFKGSFRIKRKDAVGYEIFQLGKQRKYLSCLYELQNYYKEYTGNDLNLSDFKNWDQFNFCS